MNRPEGMAGTHGPVMIVTGPQRAIERIRLISCYGITHPPELAAQRMTNPAANDAQYADTPTA